MCSKCLNSEFLSNFLRFDILSKLNSLVNFANLDIDSNIPYQANFQYYDSHKFHCNIEIKNSQSHNSFSALHCNIGLVANFESFPTTLSESDYPFSVLGLSEIRTKDEQSILNISLSGYRFIQKSSLSEVGEVTFFLIKENLSYCILSDSADNCHKSLWIEIDNGKKQKYHVA